MRNFYVADKNWKPIGDIWNNTPAEVIVKVLFLTKIKNVTLQETHRRTMN